ncbi:hypothetical protein OG394_29210 [Kribbella sp. NBC_01245]|uniref:hypothetical protein n=1 Tax=Kribbella sp. NBC_01245 TaxID=2903578 RepID=UPI002E2D5960|nr:hypothetical protein [Kribbella sp. NBC_01245]
MQIPHTGLPGSGRSRCPRWRRLLAIHEFLLTDLILIGVAIGLALGQSPYYDLRGTT